VARMGEERNVYRVLVGKPEGKRQLRRSRHRWEVSCCECLLSLGTGVPFPGLKRGQDMTLTTHPHLVPRS
jgi:hypothetical protein